MDGSDICGGEDGRRGGNGEGWDGMGWWQFVHELPEEALSSVGSLTGTGMKWFLHTIWVLTDSWVSGY